MKWKKHTGSVTAITECFTNILFIFLSIFMQGLILEFSTRACLGWLYETYNGLSFLEVMVLQVGFEFLNDIYTVSQYEYALILR